MVGFVMYDLETESMHVVLFGSPLFMFVVLNYI